MGRLRVAVNTSLVLLEETKHPEYEITYLKEIGTKHKLTCLFYQEDNSIKELLEMLSEKTEKEIKELFSTL